MGKKPASPDLPGPSLPDLPVEIIEYLLTHFLKPQDLVRVALSNRQMASFLRSEYLWKYHLLNIYGPDWRNGLPRGSQLPAQSSETCFKCGFKRMAEWDRNVFKYDRYRKCISPDRPYQVTILFAGPTEAGKLSLVNACLGRKRSQRDTKQARWTVLNRNRWRTRKGNPIHEVHSNFVFLSTSREKHPVSLTPDVAQSIDMVCLVFSLASKSSFKELENYFHPYFKRTCGDHVKYLLVGCKSDLRGAKRSNTSVSRAKALAFAEKVGCRFITTSAADLVGTDDFMSHTVTRAVEASLSYRPPSELQRLLSSYTSTISILFTTILIVGCLLWNIYSHHA